jgi:hypothetical protein
MIQDKMCVRKFKRIRGRCARQNKMIKDGREVGKEKKRRRRRRRKRGRDE